MDKPMSAPPGTYRDPTELHCFKYCTSCGRCSNKDRYNCGEKCSGRLDKAGCRVPHADDYCRCAQGILQWVTQEGRLVQVRMQSDPFAAVVKYDNISQDEADWNSYLADTREKLDDPNWDPVQFDDGTSTDAWNRKHRG